ncbi:MAG: hypothetical protein U1E59_01790 [Amaricoccus sp.]
MLFREYPLLNTPNLVVVILRAAAAGPATLDDCMTQLQALLDRADEHPPFGPADVAPRLATLVRYLTEARLLAPDGDDRFTVTERGQAALRDRPQGFDTADLMAYPEFARYVRGLALRRGPVDARSGGYDRGFDAYWNGDAPADNPFAADSADHLAWENGWSEALDEDFRWTGVRFAPEP